MIYSLKLIKLGTFCKKLIEIFVFFQEVLEFFWENAFAHRSSAFRARHFLVHIVFQDLQFSFFEHFCIVGSNFISEVFRFFCFGPFWRRLSRRCSYLNTLHHHTWALFVIFLLFDYNIWRFYLSALLMFQNLIHYSTLFLGFLLAFGHLVRKIFIFPV